MSIGQRADAAESGRRNDERGGGWGLTESGLDRRTVSRRSLHGRVAWKLGRRIVAGEIAEGEFLSTEEVASVDLSVSRTAYREAIKLLSAKGLLESRRKVGTRVRARVDWNMLDPDVLLWASEHEPAGGFTDALFEFRLVIEPAAARLAAQKRLAGPLEEMRDAMALMAATESATRENMTADLEFHAAILRASGNELLSSLWHVTGVLLARSFRISSRRPGARAASVPLHQAVCDHILRGEAEDAGNAMSILLTSAREDIEAVFGSLDEEHSADEP